MQGWIDQVNHWMEVANSILWHDIVLYIILATGILFLIMSNFSPLVAIRHGFKVLTGRYDDPNDPGAISHFQALSAALSATVGLGNIGGVAVAIALGGPGAVFWMWVVGIIGMAIKTTEVTQSMLFRDTSDPDNPRGGPMWVAARGFAEINPKLAGLGKVVGGIFCVTLLISTITGGNMFQAWSVGDITANNFGVPSIVSGLILSVICAMVIIGGIKRIGRVAGTLVPFMCGIYIFAGLLVLAVNFTELPGVIALIFRSAFSPTDMQGAFIGGTAGYAFLWGMKRALFSNEAGQGSAPIAHSAVKTRHPVREGVVAGLEPLIDTIVVCSITALVILSSGAWNRDARLVHPDLVSFQEVRAGEWSLPEVELPQMQGVANTEQWQHNQQVFVIYQRPDNDVGRRTHDRFYGTVVNVDSRLLLRWDRTLQMQTPPALQSGAVFVEYASATLTSHAFDLTFPGLGRWMVTLAAWLFAISTMISWSYYGEQGVIYLFGKGAVLPYKAIYCVLIVVATSGIVTTTTELDNLTGIGTGVMLFANIPIMLIFARKAMRAYHSYVADLNAGKFD